MITSAPAATRSPGRAVLPPRERQWNLPNQRAHSRALGQQLSPQPPLQQLQLPAPQSRQLSPPPAASNSKMDTSQANAALANATLANATRVNGLLAKQS